jgi:hypothetical protein
VRSRCVGLVTEDPALYADLASALRERGVPSVSLWPGERIPERVAVVLTSPSEAGRIPHPNVLAVHRDSGRPALWAAVQSALSGERAQRDAELVIGLDPGPTPGFAVISGGRLLAEGVLSSPEGAASFAATLVHRFPGRGLRFRIGSGDPPDRNRIVRALGPSRFTVELVDERHTTPRVARRHRDAAAAGAIARLPGRSPGNLPAVRPTPGAITDVQRRSRERSDGRFSISRAMARRVLAGELTLSEALDRGPGRSDPSGTRIRDGHSREPS